MTTNTAVQRTAVLVVSCHTLNLILVEYLSSSKLSSRVDLKPRPLSCLGFRLTTNTAVLWTAVLVVSILDSFAV